MYYKVHKSVSQYPYTVQLLISINNCILNVYFTMACISLSVSFLKVCMLVLLSSYCTFFPTLGIGLYQLSSKCFKNKCTIPKCNSNISKYFSTSLPLILWSIYRRFEASESQQKQSSWDPLLPFTSYNIQTAGLNLV